MFDKIFPGFGKVEPQKPLSFKGADWCETYVVDESTIGVRPIWINKKDEQPPKDKPFLAITDCGVEKAFWSHSAYVGFCPCNCCPHNGCTVVYFELWMYLPEIPK